MISCCMSTLSLSDKGWLLSSMRNASHNAKLWRESYPKPSRTKEEAEPIDVAAGLQWRGICILVQTRLAWAPVVHADQLQHRESVANCRLALKSFTTCVQSFHMGKRGTSHYITANAGILIYIKGFQNRH